VKQKWMWEKEYIEKMQSVEFGEYTAAEAKAMWRRRLRSGKFKTDMKGPRGTQRMKVKIGDYESSFSEVGTEDEVELTGAVKRKPEAEDIKKAKDSVLSRHGHGSMFFGGDAGADESDSSSSADGEDEEEMNARESKLRKLQAESMASRRVNVMSFAADRGTPRKRPAESGGEDSDDDDSSDSEESAQQRKAPPSSSKRRKGPSGAGSSGGAGAAAGGDNESGGEDFAIGRNLPPPAPPPPPPITSCILVVASCEFQCGHLILVDVSSVMRGGGGVR